MRAALRREQHIEMEPPSIRETLAHVESECARRPGGNHMLKTTCPQSAKLLQASEREAVHVRGALAKRGCETTAKCDAKPP
eukprot:1342529-Pyramimonas_sp.AAC.1